jgi:6-pyruvoyltetrahydropterin/6-carboxytetrahydropterin synthase
MATFKVTKEFSFSAAHRLFDYEGPCQNIHGHNYRVQVTIKTQILNDLDMAVDFQDIKQKIGTWIQENLDHAILVNQHDVEVVAFLNMQAFKRFYFDGNPTAEMIAQLIFEKATMLFLPPLKVVVYETETCRAEYRTGD